MSDLFHEDDQLSCPLDVIDVDWEIGIDYSSDNTSAFSRMLSRKLMACVAATTPVESQVDVHPELFSVMSKLRDTKTQLIDLGVIMQDLSFPLQKGSLWEGCCINMFVKDHLPDICASLTVNANVAAEHSPGWRLFVQRYKQAVVATYVLTPFAAYASKRTHHDGLDTWLGNAIASLKNSEPSWPFDPRLVTPELCEKLLQALVIGDMTADALAPLEDVSDEVGVHLHTYKDRE